MEDGYMMMEQNVAIVNTKTRECGITVGASHPTKSGQNLEYLNKILLPNLEYLKSCGICSSWIATYVCRAPLTYTIKPTKLKDIVQRVNEMGVDRKSKVFMEALKVMSCMTRESWELKLKVFRELGFSEQNVLVAFRRMPSVFGSSEKKIKQVTQLLLSFEDIS
ncbi:hypothetical protein M5689_000862 [Euphorbia peplus]|nr:hypothetical protein M5689_000862 [Euphorbia peplus]